VYDTIERKGVVKERRNTIGVEVSGQGKGGSKVAIGTIGEGHYWKL